MSVSFSPFVHTHKSRRSVGHGERKRKRDLDAAGKDSPEQEAPQTANDKKETSNRTTRMKTSKTLNDLDVLLRQEPPSILLPNNRSRSTFYHGGRPKSGTRQHHFSVLATILHRSLLSGDYLRARRAWSLFLRTESDGRSADLRFGHRWGIGAEILLNAPESVRSTSASPMELSPQSPGAIRHATSASQMNLDHRATWAKALAYYERLQIQYPHNKTLPATTGPLEFLFAKLTLWLFRLTAIDSRQVDTESDSRKPADEVRAEALSVLEELKKYADSPPFSDHAVFSRLRMMLKTWIQDLSVKEEVVRQ